MLGESQKLIRVIESKYKSFFKRNSQKRQVKKESMLESVDQARLSLAGGSALAFGVRQLLIGSVLGIGSSILSNESVSGTAADWMLRFKNENLELTHVSLIKYLIFFFNLEPT